MLLTSVLISFILIIHQNSVYAYNRRNYNPRSAYDYNENSISCDDEGICSRNNHRPHKSQRQSNNYYRRQPQTQPQSDCQYNQNCQLNGSQTQELQPQQQQQSQQPHQQPNDCHNRLDCQSNRRSHKHRHNSRNSQEIPYQSSPDLVSITALQTWNCDFSLNDCGIHNQYNMNSYFKLIPDDMGPVFGKSGVLYIDISEARSVGARLITPYFPTNGCRYGCLSIEYILCGHTIESLYLIQQDVRNYCVWQQTNDKSYRWLHSSLTIDLSRSDPRFFIELRFNGQSGANGFAAIADMTFTYGQCDHNDANECDLNQFIGTLL